MGYNLGAQSHVAVSFNRNTPQMWMPLARCAFWSGAARGLQKTRIYQASTSELYGLVQRPQKETTPFHP